MVCELKITSGSKKKLCKKSMVIRHSVKIIVIFEKQCYSADEMHSSTVVMVLYKNREDAEISHCTLCSESYRKR